MSTAVRATANHLWWHFQSGKAFAALPANLRPETRLQGYDVQAHLDTREPGAPVGWKIAATSTGGQKHIGVDGPLAGRLLATRTHGLGRTISMFGNRMRVAEPEFCFRMARALMPRPSRPYTRDEVMGAVGDLHLAIELPNSRFKDFAVAGAAQLIADNACAHETVIGPPVAAAWRTMDLAALPASIATATAKHEGVGRNVLGGPDVALTWLANELSNLGTALAAGAYVITGTAAAPLPVVPGDLTTADFGELGQIIVQLGGDAA